VARILVLDGEQRSALAATRSLGRAGHEVHVAAADPRSLSTASRHCARGVTAPDPAGDPAAYRDFLSVVTAEGAFDVLLPMTDLSIPFALELRDRRPDLVLPIPPAEAYRRASDKVELLRLAAEAGVPVPPQVEVAGPGAAADSPETAAALAPGLRFPVVVKPGRSAVEGSTDTARFRVSVAEDPATLSRDLSALDPRAFPVLLQERIQGPGLGAFALFWEGEPMAWFAHRRLREKPPTGGVSVYRESIPLRDDLRDYATRLLSDLGWSGVAMVEFKEDEATGIPYLMEINGRFWGSLQLAVDAGVDFPALLVELALGGRPAPRDAYRTGVRSRWLWGEVDHLVALARHGQELRRTHPELPSLARALARVALPWRPGDRFEVLRASDPGPFIRETANWIRDLRR